MDRPHPRTPAPAGFGPATRAGAGFTLVELLVVIGIIAVLIAILLPSLARARDQAKSIQCLSNLRQVGSAITMFVGENKGYLPKAWFNDGPRNGSGQWQYPTADTWEWSYVISGYLAKNEGVFRCPSDPEPDADPSPFGPAFYTVKLADGTREGYPRSYRLNTSNLPNGPFDAVKVSQFKEPSRSIVVAEGRRGFGGAGWNQLATWEADQGVVRPTWTPAQAAPETNVAYDRHSVRPDPKAKPKFNGRSNYVFADGHAEAVEYKDTWDIGVPGRPGGGNLSMWRQLYWDNKWPDRY